MPSLGATSGIQARIAILAKDGEFDIQAGAISIDTKVPTLPRALPILAVAEPHSKRTKVVVIKERR